MIFPSVFSLFKVIKEIDYKLLPIILQRIESYVMLEIVCKQISIEYPELYFTTLHDSIITTEGNEHIIEEILIREIKHLTGYEPKLGIKKPDLFIAA